MIVTVTPTVGEGTVVRWFDAATPDHLSPSDAVVVASRNGVRVRVFLHEVPEDVLAVANELHERLRGDPHADVGQVATHRKASLFGPYEPVADDDGRPAETGAATAASAPARAGDDLRARLTAALAEAVGALAAGPGGRYETSGWIPADVVERWRRLVAESVGEVASW